MTIADRLREGREAGSTLISVLIIMLVLGLGGMTVAAIVVNTAGLVVDGRSTAQSRAAADAGMAVIVAQAKSGGSICSASASSTSAPRYSVSAACSGGKVTFTSEGRGEDGGVTKAQAVYEMHVASSTLDGALVSANGGLNVSSIHVTAFDVDGDIILNHGSLDCNNSTEIEGDVIVRNGSVSLSNYCHVHGDVIASGGVTLSNHVQIGGDVHAMGDFNINNSTVVAGDVFTRGTATMTSGAKVRSITALGTVSVDGGTTRVLGAIHTGGTVSVNAATVTGAVTAASNSPSSFYGAKTGAIRIAGRLSQLQATTVTGDVISTLAGASQDIAPDVTITGNLTLAGTYSTWNSGPTVGGSKTENVAGLTVPSGPSVDAPWQLAADAFTWSDLPYNAAAWSSAGYNEIPTPGCTFQGNPTLIGQINSLTTPTIVDARSCGPLNLYQVNFKLKTDVTFLVTSLQGQLLKVESGDGNEHVFNIITPDHVVNQAKSCVAQSPLPTPGTIGLSDVQMDPLITGVAYSPCTIHLGQSGGNPSRWNGQVYAGTVTWGGNSGTRMILDYREVNLPGLVSSPAGGGGPVAPSGLGNLLWQRDVP
ncbi:hypothetical protein ACQ143_00360 [Microbacterium sp. MC2]